MQSWPHFKILSRRSLEGTEKEHEDLIQDSRSPGRYFIPGHPEHEIGMLTTGPQCSAKLFSLVLIYEV
jgi:hypothetical protein